MWSLIIDHWMILISIKIFRMELTKVKLWQWQKNSANLFEISNFASVSAFSLVLDIGFQWSDRFDLVSLFKILYVFNFFLFFSNQLTHSWVKWHFPFKCWKRERERESINRKEMKKTNSLDQISCKSNRNEIKIEINY